MPIEIVIPRETVNDDSVTIVLLLAAHGQEVKKGDLVAEVETSKANISIEAIGDGFLEWNCNEGEEVDATASIGRLHPTAAEVPALPARDSPRPGSTSDTNSDGFLGMVSTGNAAPPAHSIRLKNSHPLFSDAANLADHISAAKERGGEGNGKNARAQTTGNPGRTFTPPTPPFESLTANIRYDLYRYAASGGWKAFLRTLRYEPGFAATLIYRLGRAASGHPVGRKLLLPFCRIPQSAYRTIYGISIPFETSIGPGLYFPHWGGIWVNPRAVIGANVSLGHDVSIGSAGPNPGGHPVIGDATYLSPGSRITGPIRLGAQVLVSANSLVTCSAPDGSILVGVPASVAGHQTENEFITNIHPDFAKDKTQ